MAQHDDHEAKAERRKARDRDKRIEFEKRAAVESLLKHPHGRTYLAWLLEIGHADPGTQPFSTDPMVMGFNCGEMNVGNQVLAHILEVSPEGYVTLLKEREREEATDEPVDEDVED